MLQRCGCFEPLTGAEDEQNIVADLDIEARLFEQQALDLCPDPGERLFRILRVEAVVPGECRAARQIHLPVLDQVALEIMSERERKIGELRRTGKSDSEGF